MKRFVSMCFFLAVSLLFLNVGHASANDVRIGVLAIRGPEAALKYWQQVADYLNTRIFDHHFVIVPQTYKSMEQAVAEGQLDFVVANPAQYIELEVKYGASRIATKVNHVGQSESSFFGTVIFAKANRTDIVTLSDLRGKSLVTTSETAFASWVVTRDELKRHGISSGDLASVQFTDASAGNVVMAVKNGEADAGSVRTNVLERLVREGKIVLTDFRIINQRRVDGFPFLLSSELYPEFAFARLIRTDRLLADKVAAQLLLMSHDEATLRLPSPIGWTVPENYEKVRRLLQEWRLPPYQDYGKVTLTEAIRQHWVTISLAFAVFMALSVVAFLSLNIKRRRAKYNILQEAKQKLDLIHAMIVATPDAIFIKDRHGRYVFVNPEAACIIGRPTEDIIGKNDMELFPPAIAQAMMDDDSTVMSGGSSLTYEEHLALPDDSRYMLVTKGPMYDSTGGINGMFGVARDITDLKLLQQEIAEKVVQLEAAFEKVRQLEGIIPICSYCKKIRDDEKSWHEMENYISSHSEAKFSHGICPECYEREMQEVKSMTA